MYFTSPILYGLVSHSRAILPLSRLFEETGLEERGCAKEKTAITYLPRIALAMGPRAGAPDDGLARDRRGAAAAFFALAIVPLVAFLGLAIDTTRGYLVKSHLNQALDAAALAGGRVYDEAESRRRHPDVFQGQLSRTATSTWRPVR